MIRKYSAVVGSFLSIIIDKVETCQLTITDENGNEVKKSESKTLAAAKKQVRRFLNDHDEPGSIVWEEVTEVDHEKREEIGNDVPEGQTDIDEFINAAVEEIEKEDQQNEEGPDEPKDPDEHRMDVMPFPIGEPSEKESNTDGTSNIIPQIIDMEQDMGMDILFPSDYKPEPVYKLPKGYLSPTQVKMYMSCSLKYMYRYLLGMKETKTPNLVLGSSVHKSYEVAALRRGMYGDILSLTEVLDAYSSHFEYEKSNEEIEWGDIDKDKLKDDGIKLISAYYEQVGIKNPLLDLEGLPFVERDVRFEVIPGVMMVIKMDMVDEHKNIIDYKTAKTSPAADLIENTIQLPIYAMGFRAMTGEKENDINLEYMVNLKKEPKLVSLVGKATDERIERVKDTVEGVAKGITHGIFYRNEEGFACSYCSFKNTCKKGGKGL